MGHFETDLKRHRPLDFCNYKASSGKDLLQNAECVKVPQNPQNPQRQVQSPYFLVFFGVCSYGFLYEKCLSGSQYLRYLLQKQEQIGVSRAFGLLAF